MIKLRRFSLSDLEKVREIEKASFPNRDAYPNSLFEKYYKEYPEGFVVGESESEIVGYTIGRPKDGQVEIISLAVKPDFRHKGIGRKLTNFLIDHFQGKDIKEIFLCVRTKNKIGISFYQNLGFKILKTIKNYYRNGDNGYLMRKEI